MNNTCDGTQALRDNARMMRQSCQQNGDLLAHDWSGVIRQCTTCCLVASPETIDAAFRENQIRNATLEEAAVEAENGGEHDIAKAIRAKKRHEQAKP